MDDCKITPQKSNAKIHFKRTKYKFGVEKQNATVPTTSVLKTPEEVLQAFV